MRQPKKMDLVQFTRPFLLVRGWGQGTRLVCTLAATMHSHTSLLATTPISTSITSEVSCTVDWLHEGSTTWASISLVPRPRPYRKGLGTKLGINSRCTNSVEILCVLYLSSQTGCMEQFKELVFEIHCINRKYQLA